MKLTADEFLELSRKMKVYQHHIDKINRRKAAVDAAEYNFEQAKKELDDAKFRLKDTEAMFRLYWAEDELENESTESMLPLKLDIEPQMPSKGSYKELWDKYGKPYQVNVNEVIESLDKNELESAAERFNLQLPIDEGKLVAFKYSNKEAADAYAKSNEENYGHLVLTFTNESDGVINLIYLNENAK